MCKSLSYLAKFFLCIVLLSSTAWHSDRPAYRLYDAQLKTVSYEQMLDQMAQADVVLFGEQHDNPICHWLELQVTKDLYNRKKERLVLGAEMFEADNQTVLSEYTTGIITAKQLETEAKIWQNFKTDYKPLLDFAQRMRMPFVATNIPRRYASLVAKSGLEALGQLSAEAQKNIAPLPISVDLTLPSYAEMMNMGGMHGSSGSMSAENITKAQAVKDATMAHFIYKNWETGKLFLHYNGSYHSKNYEGIVWYLKKQNPKLKIVTVHSIEAEDITQPTSKEKGSADFVLAIPADMTKTY